MQRRRRFIWGERSQCSITTQVWNVVSVLEGDRSRVPVTSDSSIELHLLLPASGAALRIVVLSASRSLW